MISMEFKKINQVCIFFILFSFLITSCVVNENKNDNNKKNDLIACRDFIKGSSSSRNFCNLMYSLDEPMDTNLVKPILCDFSIRMIYNIDEGTSYIIKLYENGSEGMLKIKVFQNGELSFFRYCINGEIQYSVKNIMLNHERMLSVKAQLNSLKQVFEFNNKNKLNTISMEFIENDQYKYGIAKNNNHIKNVINILTHLDTKSN